MEMSALVDRLETILKAATGTYLTNALVYWGDTITTENPDAVSTSPLEIRLKPMPVTEGARFLGAQGWEAPLTVHIEATLPLTWGTIRIAVLVCEELLGVIRSNRSITASGYTEAVSMLGDGALKWDYGYGSKGEQGEWVVNLMAVWSGPNVGPG